MGKGCKVVVCGLASVGKTAILEQLLYGNHAVGSESRKTLEDVYVASVETDRGVKEQLRLYDTRGLHDGLELPKHYYSVADGFVLVYSVDSLESFKKVDVLKKEIDKSRDKREVPAHFHQAFKNTRYLVLVCSDLGGSKNVDCLRVSENCVETLLWKVYDRGQRGDAVMVIVLGNKTDLQEWRQVDPEAAQQWAQGEKVRLWEVTVTERDSLIEPFTVLTSRLTQPPSRSSFPLPGRRSRGTPSNDM